MPAGTVSFDKTKTLWNPGYLYMNCAVPATGSIVTVVLDANGIPTPDAAENPNHKHVGYTDKGVKASYKFTKADAMDDEHTTPHDSKIVTEALTFAGAWKQLLDDALLSTISVGGTSASITGGKLVKFGGLDTLTGSCIVLLTPKKSDPTKIIQVVMYSGYNTEGIEFTTTKEGEQASPFSFGAFSIPTRPKGDQLGYIYIPT